MFPNLKLQIFRRGSHQNRLAKTLGIDETVLSKIIHGYRDPTASQRKALASYLEADESWLFERFEKLPTSSALNELQLAVEKKAGENGDV
jgi:transcriptional regulator with XRE-family HTH domain